MVRFPPGVQPLLTQWATAFTQPTFRRWILLLLGAILTTGRHTVQNMLRVIQGLAPGHASSYQRVFSHRRWCLWKLARALIGYILDLWVAEGPVYVAGDDTVDEHRGKKVYGKGCHRDAVRSTRSYTAYRWGHKWVVLSILVKFPFAHRPWALPVLVALYRTRECNAQERRRHKTQPELMRQLLAVLIQWFPGRQFVFAGDGGFSSHELAQFAHRHRQRLTLVGRFHPNANLYEAPPKQAKKRKGGRPRKKGRKQPAPQEVVARSKATRINVAWYGGGRRDVSVVTGAGHWYKAGQGLVPVRWVFVRDRTGTHRDEYFFTTDTEMTPVQIIGTFTGRWSIETTFQEVRAYLGLETTRGRKQQTVLRVAPCLFGLYSFVALLYAQLPKRFRGATIISWVGKREITFSDAITATRQWLWLEEVLGTPRQREAFSKLSRPTRKALLYALAPAA